MVKAINRAMVMGDVKLLARECDLPLKMSEQSVRLKAVLSSCVTLSMQ